MKKLIPIIALSLLTGAITAQSLKIIKNEDGSDVTGKKLTVTVNDSDLVQEMFTVTPIIKARSVKVKRVVLIPLEGTQNSFCWADQCYPHELDLSLDAVDFTQKSAMAFSLDFFPMVDDVKHAGTFAVRYVFFDTNSSQDSTSFDIQFEVKKNAAVKNIAKPAGSLSSVYPNPAAAKAEVKYKFDNTYNLTVAKVYNFLGAEVATQVITTKDGTITLPVAELQNGLYFVSIIADNKPLATRKFTVLH